MKFRRTLDRIFSRRRPSHSPEENRAAVEHYNRAAAFQQAGRLDEAIGEFRAALSLEPGYSDARGNLANALSGLGDEDAAILEYRELLRLNPADHLSHYNLGNGLKAKGDLAGAISEYRAALKIQPRYSQALHNLGTALLATGDIDGAIAQLQAALEVNPADYLAHTNLANALRVRGDTQKATGELQRALDLNPSFAPARDALHQALREEIHLESDAQKQRTTLRRDESDYDAHQRLGDNLALQGNLRGAIIEWKAALRLRPDSPDAPDLHSSVARALLEMGDLDGAIAECR